MLVSNRQLGHLLGAADTEFPGCLPFGLHPPHPWTYVKSIQYAEPSTATANAHHRQGILRQKLPPSATSSERGIDPDASLSPEIKAELKKVELLNTSRKGPASGN